MKVGFDTKIGAYYNKKTPSKNQLYKEKSDITFGKNSFMSSIEKKLNKISDIDFIWKVGSLTVIGMGLVLIYALYQNKRWAEVEKEANEIFYKSNQKDSNSCCKSVDFNW